MLTIICKDNRQELSFESVDKLTVLNATRVKEELNNLLSKENAHLILNMENIKYIDSTGIGVLISALKKSYENNSTFLISNVNKDVMNLLKIMKLDKVFNIV